MQSSECQPHTREEGLIAALIRVGRLMKNAGVREADPHVYWLLHVLSGQQTMRMTDLAALLDLDTSTVSRQLQQLDKAGYVVRTQHPDDRRAQAVAVSPAGLDLLERAHRERARFVAERTADWDPADLETLTRLLTIFAEPTTSAGTASPGRPEDLAAEIVAGRRTPELEHA